MASSTPLLDKVKTAQQRRLVLEYAANGFKNITQAGIAAGYSQKTASRTCSKALKLPAVAAAVEEQRAIHLAKIEAELEMDAHEVIKEMSVMGRSRITDFVSFNNTGVTVKDSNEIDPHLIGAIQSIEIKPVKGGGNAVKLKLHDKNRALDSLAKVKGMLSDIDTSVQVQLIITGRD